MEKVYGTVKKVKNDRAFVSIKRDSMCGDSCASCNLCAMKDTVLNVKNTKGAKAGDRVWVEMETGGLLAAFLVYGAPVIIILLGIIIASMCKLQGGLTAIVIIAAVLVWYMAVKIAEKAGLMKGKYGAEITAIDSVEGDLN
ncbi:MAG: SoxR reducing system RseC family protein [Clostridia bacterium]|nr:SoxR reducing system RseC family protein [Clostridia bacterium]